MRGVGFYFARALLSPPFIFFFWLAGMDANERIEGGEKENEVICGRIDRQVRAIDQRVGRDGEMGGGGVEKGGGEGNDVVLCLRKRATRGVYPHKWPGGPWGSLWMGPKLGHLWLSQPRRLPWGATFINSSWRGGALRSIFPPGAFQPGTSILIFRL